MRMIGWTAVVCIGVLSTGVAAQQDEAEHEALRQLRGVYEAAMRDSRPEALAPFVHDDFHGVMVTGRVVRNLAELTKFWSDIKALIGEGGTYTTTLEPERSVLIGDVALARGTSQDVVVARGGHEFRFTTMWTAVLQKVDGRWKVRQMQGTIDPVDNVFIREFTRRALLLTGAISAAVGGLLTWGLIALIGRWRRRRPATASPQELPDNPKDALKSYILELSKEYYEWYKRHSSRLATFLAVGQGVAIVAGMLAAVLAASVTKEALVQFGFIKTTLVVLPLVGTLASSLLAQAKVRELLALRERGRERVQSLISQAETDYAGASDDAVRLTAIHSVLVADVSHLEQQQATEFLVVAPGATGSGGSDAGVKRNEPDVKPTRTA